MSDRPAFAPLPRAVAWLGYGGLLPFIGLALAVLLQVQEDLARAALVGYGAVILSFVGALHWGFAMMAPGLEVAERTRLFAWSTVPALAAWPALLVSPPMGALILVAGFAAHYLQDRRLARRHALPAWYLPLRLQLSSVACLSLVTLVRG